MKDFFHSSTSRYWKIWPQFLEKLFTFILLAICLVWASLLSLNTFPKAPEHYAMWLNVRISKVKRTSSYGFQFSCLPTISRKTQTCSSSVLSPDTLLEHSYLSDWNSYSVHLIVICLHFKGLGLWAWGHKWSLTSSNPNHSWTTSFYL